MPTENPYCKWLHLPIDCTLPNYYQFLSLPEFEADQERIRRSATERIGLVRKYQIGQDAELAIRVVGELSAAFACLSNLERKAAYDVQLRAESATLKSSSDLDRLEGAVTATASLQPPLASNAPSRLTKRTPTLVRAPRRQIAILGVATVSILLLAAGMPTRAANPDGLVGPYLGVLAANVDDPAVNLDFVRAIVRQRLSEGVVLLDVEKDSPASRAGLKTGDYVVSAAGNARTSDLESLENWLNVTRPNVEYGLEAYRPTTNGMFEQHALRITIEQRARPPLPEKWSVKRLMNEIRPWTLRTGGTVEARVEGHLKVGLVEVRKSAGKLMVTSTLQGSPVSTDHDSERSVEYKRAPAAIIEYVDKCVQRAALRWELLGKPLPWEASRPRSIDELAALMTRTRKTSVLADEMVPMFLLMDGAHRFIHPTDLVSGDAELVCDVIHQTYEGKHDRSMGWTGARRF